MSAPLRWTCPMSTRGSIGVAAIETRLLGDARLSHGDDGTTSPRPVYRARTSEERTAMRKYLLAGALVALALPALAAAKGPMSPSVSGPSLDAPLTIRGDGEGPGTALGTLAMKSGFFPQM